MEWGGLHVHVLVMEYMNFELAQWPVVQRVTTREDTDEEGGVQPVRYFSVKTVGAHQESRTCKAAPTAYHVNLGTEVYKRNVGVSTCVIVSNAPRGWTNLLSPFLCFLSVTIIYLA
jgi:hypothetical protein